jgi:hypothetical protein
MPALALLLGLALAFTTSRLCAQGKDSIYLYNGQELIGDIQNASMGVISIDDIDLKIQNIKLYKIKRLVSRQIFKIETYDKRTYYNTLAPDLKEGWIIIRQGGKEEVVMPIVNIRLLTPLNQTFFKSLDGNLSAGFTYAKSSNIGQVNFSTTVSYSTKQWNFQLSGSEIGSLDSSKYSRDNENLQLFGAYDLSATWFAAGVIQYQRNLELSIARRLLEMLGAGKRLVIKETWQLLAVSGLSLSQERSTQGQPSGPLYEIPLMFRFNFYQFHHPNIQITTTETIYYSLSESGRVRIDGSTNISWELVRYFYFTLNPYTNYDSKPPGGNSQTFDFGLSLSLTYKF